MLVIWITRLDQSKDLHSLWDNYFVTMRFPLQVSLQKSFYKCVFWTQVLCFSACFVSCNLLRFFIFLFLNLWFLSRQIFETYSTVCKPLKKQNLKPTQQISGQIGSGEKDPEEPVPVPSREHYYAAVGEKTWSKSLDSDPAYATINPMQKREMLCSSTLKPKKSPCGPSKGPERAMTCENFYETIGDVKQSTNTTTIFTFKDGMEMYVTGLQRSWVHVNSEIQKQNMRLQQKRIHTWCIKQ